MKILSIDTSSKLCAVAILEDTELLKEISLDTGLTHSESLMPIIQNIFQELNLSLKDIDLIVCDKGPGSFTGIRIGIATAKAFSDSLNINSIGISSLETLAYNVPNNGIICSLIDAKKENAYFGIYEKIDDAYFLKHPLSAEHISKIIDLLSSINQPITFVGDGSIEYKDIIIKSLPNSIFAKNNDISAQNLGLVGFNKFKQNQIDDLLPLYIRKPQAERILEEKIKNG